MQLGKLYSYYLKKIFRKNGIRITFVSLFLVGVVGFLLPFLFYKGIAKTAENSANREIDKERFTAEEKEALKGKVKTELNKFGFYDTNRWFFGVDKNPGYILGKSNRRGLAEDIKLLAEKKKAGASEKDLEVLQKKIIEHQFIDKFKLVGIDILIYNSDNAFFFNNDEKYTQGKDFGKLLNDISLANLTGFIVLFGLVFNILDNVFYHPQKSGEEAMILNFTPGVKRSDLFFGKILAFLTFYSLINIVLFILPYGFYYFGIAEKASISSFALLSLYGTLVAPTLFFGLVLAPYIFFNSFSGLLGGIISTLVSFLPMVGEAAKRWAFPPSALPYKLENFFFDPVWFTVISLVIGIFFLVLYYGRYQEEDL